MRILVMAGGTGGHIFPALAVALRLREQGHEVAWLGVKGGMEDGITARHEIKMFSLLVAGVRGKGLVLRVKSLFKLGVGFWQALWVMLSFRPSVVLGMGGYVTGPGGVAAWLTRRRLVVHEQNAIAGMTNRILARFSDKVLEAFPRSFGNLSGVVLTGNPVRSNLQAIGRDRLAGDAGGLNSLRVLVLGGSGGARALNNVLPQVVRAWRLGTKLEILHQAGKRNYADAQQAYEQAGIEVGKYRLVDFIEDMAQAYAWADIVICRAGALTVAELALAGVGSILIPYPYAVDDHQTKNARYLADAGAGLIVPERELSAELLRAVLEDLVAQPQKLKQMALAAHGLSQPQALDLVVTNVLESR